MGGDVEADRLGLVGQAFEQGPIRHVGQPEGFISLRISPEQADLAGAALLGAGLGATEDRLSPGHHLGAVLLQAFEGAGAGQVLDLHLVEQLGVHPPGEVGQRGEGPLGITGLHQILHRRFADALHGGQGEADRLLALGRRLDAEFGAGAVDVGRQDRDAEPRAFLHVAGELVGVRQIQRHRGGEEGDGVVRLQPGRLVADQRIGGRVGFVEAVVGEALHQVEDLGGLLRRDAAALGAVAEDLALGFHLRADLLAHGAAQQVGGAEAVAGQVLRDLHDLFLIDHDAVGLGQDVHDRRMRRLPRLAQLARAIGRDVRHRARAVERHGGDEVLEAGRAHLPKAVAHPLPFELEHAGRVALGEHGVGLGVVERDGRDVNLHALGFQDGEGAFDHRQRLQAEEVELHQRGRFRVFHRVLCHQHRRARVAIQRDDLDQRLAADHHAGGMGRGVAEQAFDLKRDVHQARDLFVAVAQFLQARFALDGLAECHGLGRVERDQRGNLVDLAIGHAEHAADVAHRRLRLQLAEGDDLRDAVGAVFAHDVLDDLVAAVLAEVDVEVGHRDAFGVEEALEQQAKAQRVEVGDQQRPGGDRTGTRATAGADRDRRGLRLGPLDEVGDDQEVAGEAHLLDDAEFVVEPVAIDLALRLVRRWLHGVEALFQPLLRHGADGFGLGHALADLGADRQFGLLGFRHDGAHAGDGEGVVAGLGQVGEQLAHHRRRLEPVLGGDAAALALGHGAALGDAEQRVVCLMHLAGGEIDVIGGDDGQARLGREGQHAGFDGSFLRQAVAVQLDGEAVGEGLAQFVQDASGGVAPAVTEQPRDRTEGAAGQQEDALGMPPQQVQRDRRPARGVVAQIAVGGELLEVLQPRRIHRQGDQRVGVLPGDVRAVRVGLGAGEEELAAHDGLHALL